MSDFPVDRAGPAVEAECPLLIEGAMGLIADIVTERPRRRLFDRRPLQAAGKFHFVFARRKIGDGRQVDHRFALWPCFCRLPCCINTVDAGL